MSNIQSDNVRYLERFYENAENLELEEDCDDLEGTIDTANNAGYLSDRDYDTLIDLCYEARDRICEHCGGTGEFGDEKCACIKNE